MTARQLWDTLIAMDPGPGDVPPKLKIEANGTPLPPLVGQLSQMRPDGEDIFFISVIEEEGHCRQRREVRVTCDHDCITMLTPMCKRNRCPKCGDDGQWINLGLVCRKGHGVFG